MTNQNCLACHQPMIEMEIAYRCENKKCFLVNRIIPKEMWSSRPVHPLEEKVREFRERIKQMMAEKGVYPPETERLLDRGAELALIQFNYIFGEGV